MAIKLITIFSFCSLLVLCQVASAARAYYGTRIGALSQFHHGVSGDVYAVDSRTLFLKNFNYDGEGPAAYFYVGNTKKIHHKGAIRLRDERGSTGVIKRYRNKDITLSLPEGKTLRDVKWFSVWCDEFEVNFGDVTIPKTLEYPRPVKISSLSGVHGVSSDSIVIVDAQTILIPNFSYDGEAPDAKFWVGRGPKPTSNGVRIPDENGREAPLVKYDKKTVVLTLPGDLTIFDIGHFGIWCEAFTVDFGHVKIPDKINVPPSLKMLGISPQSKLNCEVLYDDLAFEVRWAVAGESIVVQLVAKLDDGDYMAFGISSDREHTVMVGSDAVVAWIDKETGKGFAEDYFLDAKSQCSGGHGSCPDTRLSESSNSIRVLNAALVNGYSIVTFQRPLKATDRFDLPIISNISQAIVWAVGPLNQRQEVSYHSLYTRGDRFIQFGREPVWNCPLSENDMKMIDENMEEFYNPNKGQQHQPQNIASNHDFGPSSGRPEPEINRRPTPQSPSRPSFDNRPSPPAKVPSRPTNKYWEIPPVQCWEPEDGVFYAQMGPTGGKQGYPAITGHVGWGISWYINGLLIPEINVVRGRTYTFVVEGGNDPDTPARYHPFYITDDEIGGYEHKTDEEKANVRIFAGAERSRYGNIVPTGIGRLCNWTPDPDGPSADEYTSFGAYQRSLSLKCDEGEPGVIHWRPDDNTPDTVYYQCFTHRYLGWKINVLDACDHMGQGSDIDEVYALPEDDADMMEADSSMIHESKVLPDDDEDMMEAEASIRHESKVLPDNVYLLQHEIAKNHQVDAPRKTSFESHKSLEISKIIADGIRAAEALEESIKNNSTDDNTDATTDSDDSTTIITEVADNNEVTSENVRETLEPLPTYLTPPRSHTIRPFRFDGRYPTKSPNYAFRQPQPSLMLHHYKKPPPGHQVIRVIYKEPKPMKPLQSYILREREQPHLISPVRKTYTEPRKPYTEPRKPYTEPRSPPKMPLPPPTPSVPLRRDFVSNYNKRPMPVHQKHAPPVPLRKTTNFRQPINGPKNKFHNPYSIKKETGNDQITSVNDGFRPSSVVIESGFMPIVKGREQDVKNESKDNDEEQYEDYEEEQLHQPVDQKLRRSDQVDESDTDALFANDEDEHVVKSFEPMFIPSPLDSINMSRNVAAKKRIDDLDNIDNMEMEDGEDKMAMAGERHDAYYLPPDNDKSTSSVVTYDGKAVDMPGPAPPSRSSYGNLRARISSTEQLVHTPQFGPFRGEIPPLAPQIESKH